MLLLKVLLEAMLVKLTMLLLLLKDLLKAVMLKLAMRWTWPHVPAGTNLARASALRGIAHAPNAATRGDVHFLKSLLHPPHEAEPPADLSHTLLWPWSGARLARGCAPCRRTPDAHRHPHTPTPHALEALQPKCLRLLSQSKMPETCPGGPATRNACVYTTVEMQRGHD